MTVPQASAAKIENWVALGWIGRAGVPGAVGVVLFERSLDRMEATTRDTT